MQVHNLVQGSPEWHAYRRNHFNASDAPAMLGCSPYKTRDQLIAELATGITPEVDAATQRIFDAGHRFEALARPLAEKIIGEELAPLVGSNGKYSASFDGVTLMGDTGWEHKSLNAELRAAMVDGCTGADLPKVYRVQMEQQCMVEESLTRVLFTASKWDGDELVEARHCWYTPDPALRAEIVAGWAQLEKEVAAYVAPEAEPAPVIAKVAASLPVVFEMRVEGKLIACNLEKYKPAALAYIAEINTELESDQDFADADADAKFCRSSAEKLELSVEQALGNMGDIYAAMNTVREIATAFNDKGLALEKLVKAKKETIKLAQVQRGQKAFAEHMAGLNTRLGKPYMPTVPADFAGVIKGKRTVDSLRGAVNDELARAKLAANEIADRIQLNLTSLRELATAHAFLFADAPQLVMKANDDLVVLIKSRIGEHEAKEAARLEAERERIRAEEQAKAQREAEAKVAADARAAADAEAAERRAAAPTPAPQQEQAPALIGQAQAAIEPVAAPAANVVQMRAAPAPAAAPATAASLKLGTITERLGFALTADFLANTLGFSPAATDRASKLYHEADFPHICAALVRHIEGVQAKAAA